MYFWEVLGGFINAMMYGNIETWAKSVDWSIMINQFFIWFSGLGLTGTIIFWMTVGNAVKIVKKLGTFLFVVFLISLILSRTGGVEGIMNTLFS